MVQFFEEYCIQHGQSSPYNPQSNGHAERNVKIVKDLILKTNPDINSNAFLDGITQIRNSPRADGFSPCQVVFGRSIRTLIPTLTEALGTNEFVEKVRERKINLDKKQKLLYNRNAKTLKPLKDGTMVWVQNPETKRWDATAKILGRVRNRTYKIIMEDGKVTHRNRKWIRTKEVYPKFQNSTDTNQKSEQVKTYDDVPKYRRSKRIEARSKK